MRKSSLFGLIIAFASLGAGAACSSVATSTTNNNPDGGPTTDNDGGNPNPDGGPSGGTVKSGSVTLSQTVVGTSFAQYTASASFSNRTVTGGTPTNPCETATEGSCVASVCNIDTSGGTDAGTTDAGATTPTGLSAGDITVEALQTFTMSFDAETGTYSKSAQSKLYDSGGQIHISAVGADVPTFDDTIGAPPSVTLTAPVAAAAGQKVQIDGAAQLDLTWSGGAAGSLTASVSTLTSTKIASVVCSFDANAGSGTIPASLMAKLLKGDGSLLVTTATVETLKAGDYDVTLTANGSPSVSSATVK